METNPNPTNRPKRGFARLFSRWLFLVIGIGCLFVAGYELTMRLVFHIHQVPGSRPETFVFAMIHLIAVVFVFALMVWILREVFRHVK